MQVHAVASLFPAMSDAEFGELVADIAANGVREPVWTKNGALIDGRHRWKACEQLGIDCPTREYEGDDLVAFVVSLNLRRRHLDESQRAYVAAKLATLTRGRPEENPPIGGISASDAATLLNVGTRSVERARKVLSDGVGELQSAVESGEISVSAAAEIAAKPADVQVEAVRHFRANFTGENEWYTPAEYVERVRALFGGIDLDPASNAAAQQTVKAVTYFSQEDDGLSKEWRGRVWLNPPYAQPLIGQFVEKLKAEYEAGRLVEAVMLTHNYTDTAWFHSAQAAASAICFTRGRIRFVRHDGFSASPTQGQAFFYFGNEKERFASAFSDVGFIR